MADARKARPVSGEIMAAGSRDTCAQVPQRDLADIVDADFEVLPAGPADGESGAAQAAFPDQSAVTEGMDMLCLAGTRQPAPRSRGGAAFWLAGVALAAAAFWVSGGHAVLRASALPFSGPGASFRIAEINSRVDLSGQRPVLLVDGAAVNDGSGTSELPPIDVSIATNDGRMLHYRLGTGAALVAPGARWDFSSRLDVPMNGIRTVTVAFSE